MDHSRPLKYNTIEDLRADLAAHNLRVTQVKKKYEDHGTTTLILEGHVAVDYHHLERIAYFRGSGDLNQEAANDVFKIIKDPTVRKYEEWGRLDVEKLTEIHPIADIFPLMSEQELKELAASIKKEGQKFPIHIDPQGRVIDGRNRLLACKMAGVKKVEYEVTRLEGDALLQHNIALNLERRHLSESQRADIAAKMADGKHGGDRSKGQNCTLTQAQAAEKMAVSERSVKSAAFVQKHGAEELQAAVANDEVSVSAAAAIATLPEEEQRETVAQGAEAVKKKAKEVREKRSRQETGERPKTEKYYTKVLVKVVGLYYDLTPDYREKTRVALDEFDRTGTWAGLTKGDGSKPDSTVQWN